MKIRRSAIILTAALLLAAAGGLGSADTAFDVSLSDSVDVPNRSYSTQYGNVTVTQIGRYEEGDTLTVTVDAPEELYEVRIVDSQERNLATQSGTGGDGSYSFDLSNYDAGTYTVAVTQESDGETQVRAAQPFVVRGFSLSVDAPDTTTVADSFEVTVDVSRLREHATNERVTVLFGNESSYVQETASEQDGQYVAEVDPSQFEPGEYTLYATVKNGETYNGEDMLSALSTSQTVTLESETTATTTSDNGGSGGSGGSGGTSSTTESTGGSTTTTTTATTTTNSSTVTTTSTTTTPTTSTTTPPDDSANMSETDPTTATPPTTVTTTDRRTAVVGPGFSALMTALAVLAGAGFLLRRCR